MLRWLRREHTVDGLLARGRPGDALAMVDAALAEEPGDPELRELRATVLVAAGRVDEAAATLRQVGDHYASRGFPLRALALHLRAGDLDSRPASAESAERIAALVHLEALSGSPFFAALGRDPLVELLASLQVRRHPAGDVLLTQGAADQHLVVVPAGRVRVFQRGAGGIYALLAERDGPCVLGELSLLTGQPRVATVVTAEALDALEVHPERVDALVERHPAVGEQLRQLAAERTAPRP